MASDKVLDIGFMTDWPDGSFHLNVVEKAKFGPVLEVRNGAYRYVRLDLFDADRPGSPPLKSTMDELGSEQVLEFMGVKQGMGARAGFITQGGFMQEYGAAPKLVPLPDLGLIKRYRLEIVGLAWSDIVGGDPVPNRYHLRRKFADFLPVTDWEVLVGATLIVEFVSALFIIAFDLHLLQEDEAYLRGFGESWRNSGTSKLPEGPSAAITLGMLAFRYGTKNTPQNAASAMIYDMTKAFIELIVAPDPSLTMTGPDWAIPSQYAKKIKAKVLHAREKLLARLLKHNLTKFIAKANVYVKVASIGIDSGEFYAHYQSLNQVNTVSNSLIDFRKDKTALGLNPTTLNVAVSEHFGLPGARFVWYRLPETGFAKQKAELTFADLSEATVTGMVHIDPSNVERVTITDLLLDGTQPLPFLIEVVPDVLGEDRSYPGVDPQGSIEIHQQVSFKNGLQPLLTAQRAGTGVLNVTIYNFDHYHLVSGTDLPETLRQVPITVEKRPPEVELPEGPFELQVGQEAHVPLKLLLANGVEIDSLDTLVGFIEERDHGKELVLTDITVSKTNPWTGEETPFTFPFTVVLRLQNDDGDLTINTGPGEHARFNAPLSDGYVDGFELYSLGDYLEGMSWGTSKLEILLEGIAENGDYQQFPQEQQPSLQIQVAPTTVELDLIPVDDPLGQNQLLIEGTDLESPLVGNFLLQARALDEVLYDSDDQAFLKGQLTSKILTLNEVYVQDQNEEYQRVPFRIRLEVGDQNIVEFALPDVTLGANGGFEAVTSLRDVLRVVGHGQTDLKAELLPLPPNEEDDFSAYSLPSIQILSVSVPPPLEVELSTWTDTLGANDLSSGAPQRELIHDTGTLAGRVRNHRPGSTVEVVMLIQDGQETDLLNQLNDQGQFTVDLTMQLGSNPISVFATKPINEHLDNVGPSSLAVDLVGAEPQAMNFPAVDIPLDVQTGTRYLKEHRSVGFSVRYARVTSAAVDDVIVGAPTDAITSALAQSYNEHTETGLSFIPDQIAGVHVLTLTARNDFAERYFQLPFLTEPRLIPEQLLLIPQGFFKPGDPTRVGNETDTIRIEMVVECTQRVVIENLSVGGPPIVNSLSNQFAEAVLADVGLVVGINTIQIQLENEFAVRTELVTVRRRANIWSRTDGSISIVRLPINATANLIDTTIRDESDIVQDRDDVASTTFTLPDQESSDIADLVTHSLDWWNNNDAFSCLVTISGTLTGPNFQQAALCFFRIDAAVNLSSPANQRLGDADNVPDNPPEGWSDDAWNSVNLIFDGSYYTQFVSREQTTGSGDPLPVLVFATSDPES